MSKKIQAVIPGTATTSGAVTSTVASIDLATASAWPDGQTQDNCVVYVEAVVVGRNTSGSVGSGGAVRIARAFRRVSGTLTAIDAATISVVAGTLQAGLLGSTFDINASGTAIRVQATGIAANDIEWRTIVNLTVN